MSRLGRTAKGIQSLTVRIALWPVRVVAARAAFAQLAAMSARDLADIGLTPQDLHDITALPLAQDPTRALADRAAEARQRALERRAPPRPPSRRPLFRPWARTGS